MTFVSSVEQIVYEYVTYVNGEDTDKELNYMIAKEITKNNESLNTNVINVEMDNEKELSTGCFIFTGNLADWTFTKYNTIAEAVRNAVKMINAHILYKGNTLIYDALSDTEAYYIDNESGKVKLVEL